MILLDILVAASADVDLIELFLNILRDNQERMNRHHFFNFTSTLEEGLRLFHENHRRLTAEIMSYAQGANPG